MRQVILDRDEDGVWIAEVPSLPGCVSQGDTKDEALSNAAEAAELWIESARELGMQIPMANDEAEIAVLPRKVG